MFRPKRQMIHVIQTEERLPSHNSIYEGIIASDKIHKYYVSDEKYLSNHEGSWWETYLVKAGIVNIPTKEELAAIDAVKKAEESLKAAKKSLELIKENK